MQTCDHELLLGLSRRNRIDVDSILVIYHDTHEGAKSR
jgi:hypothetical protein